MDVFEYCDECGEYHDKGESDRHANNYSFEDSDREDLNEEEKINLRERNIQRDLNYQLQEVEEIAIQNSMANFDYLRINDSLEILEIRFVSFGNAGHALVRGLSLSSYNDQPENISKIHTLKEKTDNSQSLEYIGEIINSNSNIKTLELCGLNGSLNVEDFLKIYLKNNSSLKTLIIKPFRKEEALVLIEVMKANKCIEIVELSLFPNRLYESTTKVIKLLSDDSRIITKLL